MTTARKISAATVMAAALALGACASGPQAEAPQDMEYVWGCWVQKQAFDTNRVVFLRLLPNADRSAYEGQLLVYSNNAPEQGGRVSFARDGSLGPICGSGCAPSSRPSRLRMTTKRNT